jgi:predicted GTPase
MAASLESNVNDIFSKKMNYKMETPAIHVINGTFEKNKFVYAANRHYHYNVRWEPDNQHIDELLKFLDEIFPDKELQTAMMRQCANLLRDPDAKVYIFGKSNSGKSTFINLMGPIGDRVIKARRRGAFHFTQTFPESMLILNAMQKTYQNAWFTILTRYL